MKITLTAAEIETILRAHVKASVGEGVEVYHGKEELDYGRDYESPSLVGFSFEYQKKEIKTKYTTAKALILGMPRNNLIPVIKALREAVGTLTHLELADFPVVRDKSGFAQTPTPTLGLAYSKALVENVWVQNPDLDF